MNEHVSKLVGTFQARKIGFQLIEMQLSNFEFGSLIESQIMWQIREWNSYTKLAFASNGCFVTYRKDGKKKHRSYSYGSDPAKFCTDVMNLIDSTLNF